MGKKPRVGTGSAVDQTVNAAVSEPELEQCRKRLGDLFPGRKEQIEELLSVLGEPGDTCPPLLLYGGAATGKSSVVREAMALLKRPFAYVSCRSCHGPSLVFESVLNQLVGHVRCKANNYGSAKKCMRLSEFVSQLGEICKDKWPPTPPNAGARQVVYLIFDDVELVRGWVGGGMLMSSLVTLSNLTRLPNLGLIFISNAGPETLQLGTCSRELLPVYFRDYSNEELYSILVMRQPNSELYSSFVKTSLAPFSRASRILTELSEGLHPLFENYQNRKPTTDQGRRELFTYLKTHMQPALSQTISITDSVSEIRRGGGKRSRPSTAIEFQLSLCSKYLLLASYIASRNPSTVDDALFGTGDDAKQRKKRRRRSSTSAMEKMEADMHEKHLKAPSNFPLERLLAIYRCVAMESSLVSEQARSSGQDDGGAADVLMQLATLVSVNLVLRSSSSPLEVLPRFRSNVESDFILKVAGSIQFPLSKYLLHG